MRTVIIIIVVLAVFFSFTWWTQNMLTTSAKELSKNLESLESAVRKNDWTTAKKQMEKFQTKWEKTKNRWQMFIDHQEVDNIESTLSKAKSWIDQEGKEDTLAEISTLKLYLLHIPEKESLKITNIL